MPKAPSNASLALNILAIAIGMLCMAYAAVPLYDLFCRATGFGGTTQIATELPDKIYDREITVRFNADTDPNLPWGFSPEQKRVNVKVGEQKLIFYSAENLSSNTEIGTSVFNVTPSKAGSYFNKIECFCFDEKTLKPKEKIAFPVSFFIDPAIMEDKKLDDVDTITLSYTFFRVKQ